MFLFSCSSVNALRELCQSDVQLGQQVDLLARCLGKTFGCLDGLGKHLLARARVDPAAVAKAKYHRLVGLVSSKLTKKVYTFLTHIDKKQKAKLEHSTYKVKKAEAAAAKRRALKEAKTMPALIFKIEEFEKTLIKLSTRCKLDLMEGVKVSTARDFRLDKDKLPENEGEGQTQAGNEREGENIASEAASDEDSNGEEDSEEEKEEEADEARSNAGNGDESSSESDSGLASPPAPKKAKKALGSHVRVKMGKKNKG